MQGMFTNRMAVGQPVDIFDGMDNDKKDTGDTLATEWTSAFQRCVINLRSAAK